MSNKAWLWHVSLGLEKPILNLLVHLHMNRQMVNYKGNENTTLATYNKYVNVHLCFFRIFKLQEVNIQI